jgi:hypothetical protein
LRKDDDSKYTDHRKYRSMIGILLYVTTSRPDVFKNQINEYKSTTIDIEEKYEKSLYYYQTLRVGKHHTMDPIMEGILSCSLASLRGKPPNELHIKIQYFSSYPVGP